MSGEQAKLTLRAVFTYDAEIMHSGDSDPEARDWFMFDVLCGGGLVLHDNKEIGDAIGTLSQVELVAHDDAAELRAALEQLLVAVEGESNRLGLMGMVDGYYAPCLGEADAAVVRARAALAATEEEL